MKFSSPVVTYVVLLMLPLVASTKVAVKEATSTKKAPSLRNLQRYPDRGDYYNDREPAWDDDDSTTATVAPSGGSSGVEECEEGYSLFELELTLDAYPFETYWHLQNTCSGRMIVEGGTYTKEDAGKAISERFCIEDTQGLYFVIYDWSSEEGDGLCCDGLMPGNYSVSYAGETVISGGEFGYMEETSIVDCTATPAPSPNKTEYPTWAPEWPKGTPAPTPELVCPIGYDKVKECAQVTRAPRPTPSPTTAAPTGENGCPKGESLIELKLKLDDWAPETSWYGYAYTYEYMCYTYEDCNWRTGECYEEEYCYWGSHYDEYWSGYNYRKNQTGTEIYESKCIPHGYTFQFYINDNYGDGMCCEHGEGSYSISVDGEVQKTGGDFEWYENFYMDIGDIVEPYEDDEYMYPEYFRKDNPTKGDIVGNLDGMDTNEEAPPAGLTEEQLQYMKPWTKPQLPPGVTNPGEKGRRLLTYKK